MKIRINIELQEKRRPGSDNSRENSLRQFSAETTIISNVNADCESIGIALGSAVADDRHQVKAEAMKKVGD